MFGFSAFRVRGCSLFRGGGFVSFRVFWRIMFFRLSQSLQG